MRRIEYSRRREEASCGVRGELLNRGSGVRIPAPAPTACPITRRCIQRCVWSARIPPRCIQRRLSSVRLRLSRTSITLVSETSGTVDTVAGNAIVTAIARQQGIPLDLSVFRLSWWLVAGALALATLFSALSGFFPALRASRLDPVAALRYE